MYVRIHAQTLSCRRKRPSRGRQMLFCGTKLDTATATRSSAGSVGDGAVAGRPVFGEREPFLEFNLELLAQLLLFGALEGAPRRLL